MQPNPLLRDYQQAAVAAVFAYWQAGRKNPLVEVPTGGGKSRIIGAVSHEIMRRKGRVLVVTHRSELVEQDAAACRLFSTVDDDVGIYCAKLNRREIQRITVASNTSIAKRHQELGRIDCVIVDEAHLIPEEADSTYRTLLAALRERRPGLQVLGLTATPYRTGQGMLTQGEERAFDAVAFRIEVAELLERGHLAPLVTGDPSAAINVDKVAVRLGDYVSKDLELAANVDEINTAVADDVARALKAGRTSALLFGVSVPHAQALAHALRVHGIECGVVFGDTPDHERRRVLDDFKRRKLPALASMGVLTTGFDSPATDVLVLARPTQSTSLYVQMAGRGMRTADGKNNCLVLDYGGNIARHGPVDDVKIKEKRSRRGEKREPVKMCKQCFAEVAIAVRRCECGYEWPAPERKANKEASRLSILGKGERTRHMGATLSASLHRKRVDEGEPLAKLHLRVTVRGRDGVIGSLFFGFGPEHESWKRKKAQEWWSRHMKDTTPPSLEADALARFTPRPIDFVETIRDGAYNKIVHVELAHEA